MLFRSSKATLWMKALHEGALATLFIVRIQRRHPAAAALQEGGPAAPVPPHPRAPRVRAPGLQKLPGWRRRDFWAAPPSPATTLRSQRSESPWRLCCSIQDQAPRLPAGLQSTPAGRCPEAAPPARVPHSPFPVEGGIQLLHPGCSATAHGPLEKEMATHSSILAWRIPGTGKPGGLPSMGSHRVGHD